MSSAYPHLNHANRTDVGRKREHNEDSHASFPDSGIYLVADGMGGGEAGEVASQLTVTSVREALPSVEDRPGVNNLVVKSRALRRAANQACHAIRAYVSQRGFNRSGSTFAALVFDPNQPAKALALHAGDSRVYRFRKNKLEQITRDHSVAAAAGLTNEDKIPTMFKGVITRAVGILDLVELEETPIDVKPGDLFLVCSDGLSNMIPDGALGKLLKAREEKGLEALADQLIAESNQAGGVDNITAILVEVRDDLIFDQPPTDLQIPEDPFHEESGGPATDPTGDTRGSAPASTSGQTATSELAVRIDDPSPPTMPTAAASPASVAPAAVTGTGSGKLTFADLDRMAGNPPPAKKGAGLPPKAWLLIGALVLLLVVVLLIPGGNPKAPAPKPDEAANEVPPAPPLPTEAKSVPVETPPPAPLVPAPAPDPVAPVPPTVPAVVAPAAEPVPAPVAPPKPEEAAPAVPAPTEPPLPVPPPITPMVEVPAPPPPPPPPVKPTEPPPPTAVDVALAVRAATTNGTWGVVRALREKVGAAALSELAPATAAAAEAWCETWAAAQKQEDLTTWFDPIFDLEDQWKELLPAQVTSALNAPAQVSADSYCALLAQFARRLPLRAEATRPVWEGLLGSFGPSGLAGLAQFRAFQGKAFPANSLAELEANWKHLTGARDVLRRVAQLAPDLPPSPALLQELTDLRLRDRALLAANAAALLVRHSVQKGHLVIDDRKLVLLRHGQEKSQGMVLIEDVYKRNIQLTQAAKTGEVNVDWLVRNGEAISQLIQAIEPFMKWQSEQTAP